MSNEQFLITSAQINPTIGDMDGNLILMHEAAMMAQKDGAKMVVFPELSLTGYYPGDLLDEAHFSARLDASLVRLLELTHQTPSVVWVVGAPTKNTTGVGKPFYNSLLAIQDGTILCTYHKQLLPTYNIFDERRHFEPGPDVAKCIRIGHTQVGFMICEDGWNDAGGDYKVNPFVRLADAAPDLIVSINASPSNVGKREQRHRIFTGASARHGLALLYVNQVGGHDQLVFDGASFALSSNGHLAYEAERFTSCVRTLGFDLQTHQFFDPKTRTPFSQPDGRGIGSYEFYRRQIVLGLQDYARRCGFTKALVGSSGGIDSALTIALAAEALGPENVLAVTLPSDYSSEGSVSDSVALCNNLGVKLIEHPIADIVNSNKAAYERATGTALQGLSLENLQARIRGTILMQYSNAQGYLLLTTGNKSELSVGYSTIYGDACGGLNLIGDLYKMEVFGLSSFINAADGREVIPQAIIDKEPSAELAPGQRDSDSLPPYPVLDAVLKNFLEPTALGTEEGPEVERILKSTPNIDLIFARVRGLIAKSEYKRKQSAPIIRVRARAFGVGRQVPITAKQY